MKYKLWILKKILLSGTESSFHRMTYVYTGQGFENILVYKWISMLRISSIDINFVYLLPNFSEIFRGLINYSYCKILWKIFLLLSLIFFTYFKYFTVWQKLRWKYFRFSPLKVFAKIVYIKLYASVWNALLFSNKYILLVWNYI